MKFADEQWELDPIDHQILMLLQEHCKMPLAKIGERVGLSAPAIIERIKKLEDNGVITGYTVTLDARKLGRDITAFIGVVMTHSKGIHDFTEQIQNRPEVLECHHVTGSYTLLLKVKTFNTRTLEELIEYIRSFDGVGRTETMVVLSTHKEGTQLALKAEEPVGKKRGRRNGEKLILHGESAS